MSNHLMDSVRRYMVARAATPTARQPLVLLLEPGGRIVVTNATAQRLAGRDDVAWIFWDRVLATADDAHRVRESIRAAFREPYETVTCRAQMHGSGELTFRCAALSADNALLVAYADVECDDDLSGEDLYDRCTLTNLDGEGRLFDRVAVDQRANLVRQLVALDGEGLVGPFRSAPGAPSFMLSMRETSRLGAAAIAASVVRF